MTTSESVSRNESAKRWSSDTVHVLGRIVLNVWRLLKYEVHVHMCLCGWYEFCNGSFAYELYITIDSLQNVVQNPTLYVHAVCMQLIKCVVKCVCTLAGLFVHII